MRIHRFIGAFPLQQEHMSIDDRGFVHQITRVLRVHPGETIILCDGQGTEAICTTTSIDKNKVNVTVRERRTIVDPVRAAVTLYCALLKRDNFELVVQKTTEIGVSRIVPLITARTVKRGAHIDRLAAIAREASEQSGRVTVPAIAEPMEMQQALGDMQKNTRNFVCDKGGISWVASSLGSPSSEDSRGLFVGPEGGWEPSECEQLVAAGCEKISLGPTILRAETAAIVATYVAALQMR